MGKIAMLGHAGAVMDVLAPYAVLGRIPDRAGGAAGTASIAAAHPAPPATTTVAAATTSAAVAAAERVAALLSGAGVGLEALLEAHLVRCRDRSAQVAFIRAWRSIVCTNATVKFLLTHKFILIRSYTRAEDTHLLQTIIALLAVAGSADDDGGSGGGGGGDGDGAAAETSTVLLETLLAVVEVWGDAGAIRSCPYVLRLHCRRRLLLALPRYAYESVAPLLCCTVEVVCVSITAVFFVLHMRILACVLPWSSFAVCNRLLATPNTCALESLY